MSEVQWSEQVAQLQATLNEGAGIATEVIGPSVVAPVPDVDVPAKYDSMAVQLSQILEQAINSAVELVEQLRRIREQF